MLKQEKRVISKEDDGAAFYCQSQRILLVRRELCILAELSCVRTTTAVKQDDDIWTVEVLLAVEPALLSPSPSFLYM